MIKICGNQLSVEVDSVPIPMTKDHSISWIVAAQDGLDAAGMLEKNSAPLAVFSVKDNSVTVYAYCWQDARLTADAPNTLYEKMACSPEFTEGCKK